MITALVELEPRVAVHAKADGRPVAVNWLCPLCLDKGKRCDGLIIDASIPHDETILGRVKARWTFDGLRRGDDGKWDFSDFSLLPAYPGAAYSVQSGHCSAHYYVERGELRMV